MSNILYKSIENLSVVWFENSNEYLVLENTTAEVLKLLNNGKSVDHIAKILTNKIDAPLDKVSDFILNVKEEIYTKKIRKKPILNKDDKNILTPIEYKHIKFYKINNLLFKMNFLSKKELSYIHPSIAHLEIDSKKNSDHEFNFFIHNKYMYLYVDNEFIGLWDVNNTHFFQGKFSMELIQKIHRKKEDEWMGVFHASAVSNDKKSVLFLGDSGNGKSTSLALLQANGFRCIADDFVPVDIKKKEVYSFPAAISIKKNGVKNLIKIYPELNSTKEYDLIRLNKIVKYLPPNNDDFFLSLPCREIVFIKYEIGSELIFSKISKIEAFQKLVPDSWISPIKENVEQFLNWFEKLNCYQLIYSDNDKMIRKVSKIFNNEL